MPSSATRTARSRVVGVHGAPASKRTTEDVAEVATGAPPLRQNIANLYLRNKLSGRDTAVLVRNAHLSNASGLNDLKDVAAKGKQMGNANRDLLRKFLKDVKCPEPYYADIPIKGRKPGGPSVARFPFLLPHEVLFHLFQNHGSTLVDELDFPEESGFAKHKANWIKSFNLPPDAIVVPVGIHGDGVPHQKRKTVEVMSWNICSMPWAERYLFSLVEHVDVCDCGCFGRHTLDAILEVFVWNTRVLMTGEFPKRRHDGSPWLPSDKARAQRSGKLGFFGALLQCRGDWAWYKTLFGFKGWASNEICWRCAANKTDVPYWDAKPCALWRKTRRTTTEFLATQASQGVTPSPL